MKRTKLLQAIQDNDLSLVKTLAPACDLNHYETGRRDWQSALEMLPLNLAIFDNKEEIAKVLISSGASLQPYNIVAHPYQPLNLMINRRMINLINWSAQQNIPIDITQAVFNELIFHFNAPDLSSFWNVFEDSRLKKLNKSAERVFLATNKSQLFPNLSVSLSTFFDSSQKSFIQNNIGYFHSRFVENKINTAIHKSANNKIFKIKKV